jgi:SAM-dependent methyltransferase
MADDHDPHEALRRSYDQIPYPKGAFAFTHPSRLAAVARLAGMNPPDVAQARVLELGCASGSNLIPLAAQLPHARFLGIDLSPLQIQAGQRTVAALQLSNIELRAMNILDVTPALGQFDYIIAHGVWSWVPQDVREKVLEIGRQNLAPAGVMYVNLNVYPGRFGQRTLRELMLLHAGDADAAPDVRVARGREMLALLAHCFAGQQTPHAAQLRGEIEALQKMADASLLHDSLAPFNEPVFCREFLERAVAHGLQYAAEAVPHTTALDQFPPHVRDVVERAAARSMVEREQLIDVLRRRVMRMTVLCHAAVELDPTDAAAERALRELHVASVARETAEGTFALPQGEVFSAPAGATALEVLRRVIAAWPQSLAVARLLVESDHRDLGPALLRMVRSGLLEVDSDPPACANTVPARPLASPLARLQALEGDVVTHLRHDQVKLPADARAVLLLADGTRTADQIAAVHPGAAVLLAGLARNALFMPSA